MSRAEHCDFCGAPRDIPSTHCAPPFAVQPHAWTGKHPADRHRQSTEALQAEIERAIEPVKDWYQSDEHEPRPTVDILADIVADLQHDRADSLALAAEKEKNKALVEALYLFREFVLRNATQWETGANQHHPIYAMIAEQLRGMPGILPSEYHRFVLAGNRDPLNQHKGGDDAE